MEVENVISYPKDKQKVISENFRQIIENNGWQEDIAIATCNLLMTMYDVEIMKLNNKNNLK